MNEEQPPVSRDDPAADPPPVPRSLPPWLAAGAPAWTWLGVTVGAGGFLLLALAWGQVAGEVDVYRQVPYVVSAGFVGMGLVAVGLGIVNVATRDADAAERERQIDQLVSVLEETRQLLGEPHGHGVVGDAAGHEEEGR